MKSLEHFDLVTSSMKRFIEIVWYHDTFSDDMCIGIADDMPSSTVFKQNDSFNLLTYFKIIFITNFKDLRCY